jgi:hypothetical protein
MNLARTSANSVAPTGGAPSRAPSPINRTGSAVTRALTNPNNQEPQKDNSNASDAAAIKERLATTTRSQELLEIMDKTETKMKKEKLDKESQEQQEKWAELNRRTQKEAAEAQNKAQQAALVTQILGQTFGAVGQITASLLQKALEGSQGEQENQEE